MRNKSRPASAILHFAFRIAHFAFLLLSLLLLSCGKSEDRSKVIYVVSPHASDIRLEFTRAFAAWHKQKYGYEVTIKWPDHGGTSDIVRYLDQEYAARKDSCGYDVLFGGGSQTFNVEADRGHLAEPPNVEAIVANMPANSPLVTLVGEFKGPKAKGRLWFAATMSNFGIAINKLRLAELNLATPREWKDVAAPEWAGHLSLADPSKSGSVLTSYEMILDQYGWEEGWRVLTLMFANADVVKDGGSNPAEETDLGNTAGGVVIDFFARNHVAKLGPETMAFLIPEGGSSLDADPIAMLKGAPNAEVAGRLIEFATSEEGQKLWVFKPKTPGGPAFKSLGRLSIRQELYTDPRNAPYLFDPTNPFAASTTLKIDKATRDVRRRFLPVLMKTCLVDKQVDLAKAREAVNALRQRDPKRADALEAKLGALPLHEGKPLTQGGFKGFVDRDWEPKPKGDATPDELKRHNANKVQKQTTISDTWREQAAKRYAEVLAEARKE